MNLEKIDSNINESSKLSRKKTTESIILLIVLVGLFGLILYEAGGPKREFENVIVEHQNTGMGILISYDVGVYYSFESGYFEYPTPKGNFYGIYRRDLPYSPLNFFVNEYILYNDNIKEVVLFDSENEKNKYIENMKNELFIEYNSKDEPIGLLINEYRNDKFLLIDQHENGFLRCVSLPIDSEIFSYVIINSIDNYKLIDYMNDQVDNEKDIYREFYENSVEKYNRNIVEPKSISIVDKTKKNIFNMTYDEYIKLLE